MIHKNNKIDIENGPKFFMPPFASKRHKKIEEISDRFQFAERINFIGKVGLVVILLGFNTIFWVVAVTEYSKEAENYL